MNKFFSSFGFALKGLKVAIKTERNFQIHFIATVLVIVMSFCFHLTKTEWMIIVLCIAAVLSAELFNTAIEKICNKIEPNYNPTIKIIKDVSAAAVLVVAIASAIIGCLLFIPKLF
jgi:diacylglycerol kinase (ATP)